MNELDRKNNEFIAKMNTLNIGAYEISKEYVMKAIKIQPTNEAKNLLSQINAKIRRGITEELKKEPDNKFLKDKLLRIEADIFTRSNEKVEKSDNKFIANNRFKIFLAITILFILIILKLFD